MAFALGFSHLSCLVRISISFYRVTVTGSDSTYLSLNAPLLVDCPEYISTRHVLVLHDCLILWKQHLLQGIRLSSSFKEGRITLIVVKSSLPMSKRCCSTSPLALSGLLVSPLLDSEKSVSSNISILII